MVSKRKTVCPPWNEESYPGHAWGAGARKGWSPVYTHNSTSSLLFSLDRVVIKRTPITLPIQLYYYTRLMGPRKSNYRFIPLIYGDSVICKRSPAPSYVRCLCAWNERANFTKRNRSPFSGLGKGLIKVSRCARLRSTVADEDVTRNDHFDPRW